jgi:hypothetical protein
MTLTEPNTVATEPIDSLGIIADVDVTGTPGLRPVTVDVRIDGGVDAGYQIGVGTDTRTFVEASVGLTQSVAERFESPHKRVVVEVTTTGPADSTAELLIGARPA